MDAPIKHSLWYKRRSSLKQNVKTTTTVRCSLPSSGTELPPRCQSLKEPPTPLMTERKSTLGLTFPAHFARIKAVSSIAALLSSIECLLLYIDLKYSLQSDSDSSTSTVIRAVGVCFSCLLAGCVLHYHCVRVKIMHARGKVCAPDAVIGMWSLREVRMQVLLELFFTLMCYPPGVDYTLTFHQLGTYNLLTLEDILYPFILLRLYHVARWGYYQSYFKSGRARFYL